MTMQLPRLSQLALIAIMFLVQFAHGRRLSEALLHSFSGGTADGYYPQAGVIRDSAGNLYGTTGYGGASNAGAVYKLSPSGKEKILHSFAGGTSDGEYPKAELLLDRAGNLYGTAAYGGASNNGVVYRIDTNRAETVLYSFKGGMKDGCDPLGSLAKDKAGNLYGATYLCGSSNGGTVFKVTARGKETVLHSFAGGAGDGEYPYYGRMLLDASGNLYGVTYQGGASNNGVVYKLSPRGKLTLLHSFAGGTEDGCEPDVAPIMDKRGNLYGTTSGCGAEGAGTVWRLSPDGTEKILSSSVGAASFSGVVRDGEGNLDGTDYSGGAYDCGSVWKLGPAGKLTTLYDFPGSHDGCYPTGSLLLDAKGNLFGVSYYGGADDLGTVWTLRPGSRAPTRTVP